MIPLTLKGKFSFTSFILGFTVLLFITGYSNFIGELEVLGDYFNLFFFIIFIFYAIISVAVANLHINGFFIRVNIPVIPEQFVGLVGDQYGGSIKHIGKAKRSNYVDSYSVHKYECTEYVFFINGTHDHYEIIIRPKETRYVKGAVILGNRIKSSLKEHDGRISLLSS